MVFFELASRLLPFHEGHNVEQIIDWIKEGTDETVSEECKRTSPAFATIMKRCRAERR
jgi:hypothetical protein